MTLKYKIGDLVSVNAYDYPDAIGIILQRHYAFGYEVKLIIDYDYTAWYAEEALQQIKQ